MKISKVHIRGFKRFTDLTVSELPETAKLVILVGPNGSGKTSLFEAFHYWYKLKGFSHLGDADYLFKKGIEVGDKDWNKLVEIEFHNQQLTDQQEIKGKFYFRTAYRNEVDFTVNQLTQQKDPTQQSRLASLMQNDLTVSENYQRLISQTLSGVFDLNNGNRKVEQLREELIGKIKSSLSSIFEDLNLSSIGDPLSNGSFYFEKGNSKDFHYKNLSAGEKSVFDLVLDMIIKSSYFDNAVYFIDEPETHMHTRLQAKLLNELYNLTPQNSQLWISTHSIGMLKEAEELELLHPNSVVFLDFDNRDFDLTENIYPAKIDKTIWNRFFDLAFADFSKLIAPSKIVFCEGTSQGRKYKDFDAQIYSKIFENKHYNTKFVSIGSCSEIENIENQSVNIISNILKSSDIKKFIDRDDKSTQEIQELQQKGIRVSKKRHIESYLLDNEIINKLCQAMGKPESFQDCIDAKNKAIADSTARGNAPDDIKSASGEIFISLKKRLSLTGCGNNKCAFLRDTITPLVTEETNIFKELENEIFS